MTRQIKKTSFKFFGIITPLVGVLAAGSPLAKADSTAKFEAALDITIRSACHSYTTEKLRDDVSWLKSLIYENSPFCDRVKAASDERDINDAMQDEFKKLTVSGTPIDFSKKHERGMNITIDCRSEYMCMETRMKFLDSENPVDQNSYSQVSDFCQERYGCIEAFFLDWPRPLPTPQSASTPPKVTFASILGGPDGSAPVATTAPTTAAPPAPLPNAPNPVPATSSSTPTQRAAPPINTPQPKPLQQASAAPSSPTSAGSTSQKQQAKPATQTASVAAPQVAQLVFGENMTWKNAMRFCKSKGMHVPSVAEGKFRLAELRTRDPHLGIWTTDQSSSDKIIGRYRTLRDNGFTEGERANSSQRVICFP